MAQDPYKVLHAHIQRLERIRRRFEKGFSKGQIPLRDLELVYEALFLRATTQFERFLENLFCGVLLRTIVYSKRRASPVSEIKSAKALYRLVWRGEKYLDWLRYEKTETRAKVFLNGGRPFTSLDATQRGVIRNIAAIRNAIAHSSEHAAEEFKKHVIAGQPIAPRDCTPARYLRIQFLATPPTRRFEKSMEDILAVAKALMP